MLIFVFKFVLVADIITILLIHTRCSCVHVEVILDTWSRVHKAFQNQDQDQAQVKNNYTMDIFKNLL